MGNPPDHRKMLMAGTVDRSTRQTIIATLDRAAPGGNQGAGAAASRRLHRKPAGSVPPVPPVDRPAPRIAESPSDQGERVHLAGCGMRC